jgi:broad specificity phosphatase PhoE
VASTWIDLVRHGQHAILGEVLCGRMPGIGLDERGRDQMSRCAATLGEPIDAIHSSPQRRALESAAVIASRHKAHVELAPALDEIDVGDWTGKRFAELGADPRWREWNEHRSNAVPPNGESMSSLLTRMLKYLEHLACTMGGARIVLVSHAEPIRVVLMHYLGVPTDAFTSVDVAPASISTVLLDTKGIALVMRVNERVSS